MTTRRDDMTVNILTGEQVEQVQRELRMKGYVHVASDTIRDIATRSWWPDFWYTESFRKACEYVRDRVRD